MASNPKGKSPCGGCQGEIERLQSALDHRDATLREHYAALDRLAEKYAEVKSQYLTLAREYDRVAGNGFPEDSEDPAREDVPSGPAAGEGSPDMVRVDDDRSVRSFGSPFLHTGRRVLHDPVEDNPVRSVGPTVRVQRPGKR